MAFDAHRTLLDQVTAAVTGLATTTSRVFESPRAAIDGGSLPALAVLLQSVEVADVVPDQDHDAELHTHRVVVAVATLATTRDQRDTSSLEVKEALLKVAKPGRERRFTRAEFEQGTDGDSPLWVITQRFEFDYCVEADEPGVIV